MNVRSPSAPAQIAHPPWPTLTSPPSASASAQVGAANRLLDDIERLIEYVAVGPRFSNVVLQTLLVLTKALPPPGRKLVIMATTAIPELLEQMELTSGFQLTLALPLVVEEASYAAVLGAAARMSPADVSAMARFMAGKPLGIKRLLAVVEMARDTEHPDAPVSQEDFMEALTEWGL